MNKQKFRLWTKKEFMRAGKLDRKNAIKEAKEEVIRKYEEIEYDENVKIPELKNKVEEAKNRKVISEIKTYEEYVKEETESMEKEGYEVVKWSLK